MRTKVHKQGHLLVKELMVCEVIFRQRKSEECSLGLGCEWWVASWKSELSVPLRREVSSFSKDLPGCNLCFQSYACIWPIHLETAAGAQSKITSLADGCEGKSLLCCRGFLPFMVPAEVKYFIYRGTLVWLSEAEVEPLDSKALNPRLLYML